jgi:hypothetical protein
MTESIHPGVPQHPNRKLLFVVLALFAAPLLLAFAVYYGSNWRPTGTTNKGELITPAIPLPAVTLKQLNGATTDDTFLRKTWTLVYLTKDHCDVACRSVLTDLGSIRLMLGKDATRLSRVFMYTGNCCDADKFFNEQPGLMSVTLGGAEGQALLARFPARQGMQALAARRIYIVDPLGNLMMSYPPGVNPRFIYQDLKKLLDLSHIG